MPAIFFLDVDINKLFEEHTVKEIQHIQKKIQYESDRKKIELRTLVGERYRDLIQAADTITEMKNTSENVISRITDIEVTFRQLQQKYLIGFKIDTPDKSSDRGLRDVSDSVVMQIKILMDIPEHIWSAIDNRDLVLAAQLFIVAQHINYSLMFEVGHSMLTRKYPIISKQWSIVSHFRSVIIGECNSTLRSLDLSMQTGANCLVALVMMDGPTSSDLLEKLIELRSRAVESIIKDESHHSVRHRIKLSLKLLINAVALIHSCFMSVHENSTGLVADYVKNLTDQQASKMLCKLDLDKDLLGKYLPIVTKNHKPFEKDQFIDLLPSDLSKSVQNWLEWIREFTSREVPKLLNIVTSIKGIYNIREESLAVVLPENWGQMWSELPLPIPNFWAAFYQPLLTMRVKTIIVDKWTEALKSLKTNISVLINKVNNDKFEFPEHDLRWLVWKDSLCDIPQKLSKTGGLDAKRSLLMKAWGYSPNVVKLCEDFDKNLHILLLDLEQYLYESERIPSVKTDLLAMSLSSISDKFVDRSEIQENLQDVSATMIEDLVKFIRNEYIAKEPKYGRREVNAIMMARFLQALTALCPSLNKCFTLSKLSCFVMTNVKWQCICDHVKEESICVWMVWAAYYKIKVHEHRNRYLTHETLEGYRISSIISEWEKVTIEEEAEDGKRIRSEIFIPYQASGHLQKFLAAVTKDLNNLIPHTVPKKVIHEIIDFIAEELFGYYNKAVEDSNLKQKQAFQILFDIKYITLLMVSRENKNLNDRSMKVCSNVSYED